MQALKIASSAEQQQAEMMQRQARAQAKLQMSGDFALKMLEGGAFMSMKPESIADYAMELADHILTKFSLDNATERIKGMAGVQQ